MSKISLAIVAVACATAQAQNISQGPAISAPGYEINSGSASLKSGIRYRYKSVASPDEKGLNLIATGVNDGGDRIHRFVIDKTTRSYFGYDLAVTEDGANRYRAEFQPLTAMDSIVFGISDDAGLKPMALPKYPPAQYVREGDIIALDLMVSADGKHKITDYLEILPPLASAVPADAADAEDISLDDGPVTFANIESYISVNGAMQQGGISVNGTLQPLSGFTGKPGATFWIALPGRGRYILSLAPHPGFLKSGTARGSTLSFHDGAEQVAVRFGGTIAGGGHTWNVYMFHDETYRPPAGLPGGVSAGTDRLDNLLAAR